jgi:predicted GTPase
MAFDYSDLDMEIESWAHNAVNQGWIDKQRALSLAATEDEDANSLFLQQHTRPLVVAFMGGTGVGKSSLLNKLAGQSIARTGVERPTSREVTLYHHQSVSIYQLDEKFPLQQIQVAQHTDSANRGVIWIDMPDFDSTEQKNKDIVMQWLPYVDVLIYVVSPERYRDNKAWRLLLAEGARHAWLFVMNQWDRGETAQYEDFKQQLSKAGFDDPLIYKTVCIEQFDDQFPQLKLDIESLATEKTVQHLEMRTKQQRKKNTKQKLQQCLHALGNEQGFDKLLEHHSISWPQTEKVLNQGFDWPIKQASLTHSKMGLLGKQEKIQLWDDWAKSRFNDYLDELILTMDHNGLPNIPLRKALADRCSKAEQIVQTQTELACRQALVNPGNILQRILLRIASVCELLLPLIAMSVVGFQVFQGYYDSSFTDEAFLGVNFAVHSVLLILISWLLPYFIRKKMQPSLEKAALKGLYKGLGIAMTAIEQSIKQSIKAVIEQHQELTSSLKELILVSDEQDEETLLEPKSDQLERMLVDKPIE